MRMSILFTTATAVAIGAAHYVDHMDTPHFVAGLAVRDGKCAELPALCTAPVMMYGAMTTMTYLCPQTMEAPTTVLMTVTTTKTITASPTDSASVPNKGPEEEPTTTTTVHSTATQYKTITVTRKNGTISTVPALTPTTPADLASSQHIPSRNPVVASTTTDAHTTSSGCLKGEFCITHSPQSALHPVNSTANGISFSHTVVESSFVQPTPHFHNSTKATYGYHFPTQNLARHMNASETAKPSTTGGASGQSGISFVVLFLGLMTTTAYLA